MPRIRVTTVGPGGRAGPALLPVPAACARAFQSRGRIVGSPGTTPIAAPRPPATPQSWNRALHRSSDAPEFWRPSLYYAVPPLADESWPGGRKVSWVSDNQMPVPAIDPRGRPENGPLGRSPLPIQRRLYMRLRQSPINQPRVVPPYGSQM